ncbi:MAG: hypothetical protein ACP5EN_08635 [Rhodovulum sp.]
MSGRARARDGSFSDFPEKRRDFNPLDLYAFASHFQLSQIGISEFVCDGIYSRRVIPPLAAPGR